MRNTFVVNNKNYVAKPFDFNTVCDLEDYGVELSSARKKPMSMVRAYFALCADMDIDDAGKEMEAHLVNGGKFDDVMSSMSKEMEISDFFRNLNKSSEEETTETPKATKKTSK